MSDAEVFKAEFKRVIEELLIRTIRRTSEDLNNLSNEIIEELSKLNRGRFYIHAIDSITVYARAGNRGPYVEMCIEAIKIPGKWFTFRADIDLIRSTIFLDSTSVHD